MKINPQKIDKLLDQIDQILEDIQTEEVKFLDEIQTVDPVYLKSARNLIHYVALRKHDIRGIQKKLMNMGISRMAHAQGHIKATILNTEFILNSLTPNRSPVSSYSGLSIKKARNLLARHTKELLGYRSKGRRVRMMVTQPSSAAVDYNLVHNMVKNGMNCARINCAHDDAETWRKIIDNVRKAGTVFGRKVKISMDLAGPKIRTGGIVPGAMVKKFSPRRDEQGKVITPGRFLLVSELVDESPPEALPVESSWIARLLKGDCLSFYDTRNKRRRLKIIQVSDQTAKAICNDTCYVGTGTELWPERNGLEAVKVGRLPAIERSIVLRPDDMLAVHKDLRLGEPAQFDEFGNVTQQAHIACLLPEIFDQVNEGETVLLDDGKIEGVIELSEPSHFVVRITKAKESGSRLKAEKGINFPTTDLRITGLTEKDRKDLLFIAEHADVVNFSFVNTKEDVMQLLEELNKLKVLGRLSIILKIETRKAFDNLTEILLTAMQTHYIGVMIARGDLAVEAGWDKIGRVQNELLSMCNAAHIPVVWATQVLENLAKKGLPSRSEITDAANSLKAECVMLNKGKHIIEAITLLNTILCDMENLAEKNEAMMPKMEKFS